MNSAEVKRRLDQYGYNKLPESTRIPFLVFLGYLWNPLSWAMEVAAILAIILLDYADFCLIIALLLVNATIRFDAATPSAQGLKDHGAITDFHPKVIIEVLTTILYRAVCLIMARSTQD